MRHGQVLISTSMETKIDSTAAVTALGALAQEHRLALFRLLVQAGEDGMPAGAIAEALGIPNSSLSFHLAQLSRAGLVRQERRHRSIIYRADYAAMNALVGYLMENCCGGAGCGADAACTGDAAPVTAERKIA
jgi:ArsR family transcriptional regulator